MPDFSLPQEGVLMFRVACRRPRSRKMWPIFLFTFGRRMTSPRQRVSVVCCALARRRLTLHALHTMESELSSRPPPCPASVYQISNVPPSVVTPCALICSGQVHFGLHVVGSGWKLEASRGKRWADNSWTYSLTTTFSHCFTAFAQPLTKRVCQEVEVTAVLILRHQKANI